MLNMFRASHRSSSGAQNCNCSLWFYIRLWCNRVVEFIIPLFIKCLTCFEQHVEHLINIGIINSSTRLHLVGYFCMIYRNNILIGSSVRTYTLMKYNSDKKTAQYIRSGHQTSAPTDINPGVNMQRNKHTRKSHLKMQVFQLRITGKQQKVLGRKRYTQLIGNEGW